MKKYSIICIFILYTLSAFSQVYDYKINPNNKNWNELKTETERLNALQIPQIILEKISTDDLIISCLNYPAFGHYLAYNYQQTGFDYVYNNFNGLQELFNRKDAGKKLLNLYKSFAIEGNNSLGIDTAYLSIRFNFLELIISQETIIKQLSFKEKQELVEVAQNKYYSKINNETFNSIYGIIPTLLIITRTINEVNQDLLKNYSSVVVFMQTSQLSDKNDISIIINSSSKFLKQ